MVSITSRKQRSRHFSGYVYSIQRQQKEVSQDDRLHISHELNSFFSNLLVNSSLHSNIHGTLGNSHSQERFGVKFGTKKWQRNVRTFIPPPPPAQKSNLDALFHFIFKDLNGQLHTHVNLPKKKCRKYCWQQVRTGTHRASRTDGTDRSRFWHHYLCGIAQ